MLRDGKPRFAMKGRPMRLYFRDRSVPELADLRFWQRARLVLAGMGVLGVGVIYLHTLAAWWFDGDLPVAVTFLWLATSAGMLLVGGIIATQVQIRMMRRYLQRRRPELCNDCGYPIESIYHAGRDACPECGQPIESWQVEALETGAGDRPTGR
jgi:hypothetical protein